MTICLSNSLAADSAFDPISKGDFWQQPLFLLFILLSIQIKFLHCAYKLLKILSSFLSLHCMIWSQFSRAS